MFNTTKCTNMRISGMYVKMRYADPIEDWYIIIQAAMSVGNIDSIGTLHTNNEIKSNMTCTFEHDIAFYQSNSGLYISHHNLVYLCGAIG